MRGTGSLRALLGQDPAKRRSRNNGQQQTVPPPSGSSTGTQPNSKESSRAGFPADIAAPGAGAIGKRGSGSLSRPATSAAAAAATVGGQAGSASEPRPTSPLKAGSVRCPVCSAQLPHDDYRINSHIDKCLSKGTLLKQTKQASIFKFAVPGKPPPQQHQPLQHEPPQQPPQQQQLGPARRRGASEAAAAAALAAGTAAAASEIIDVTCEGDDGAHAGACSAANAAEAPALAAAAAAGGPAAAAGQLNGASRAATARPGAVSRSPGMPKHAAEQSSSVSWSSQSTPGSLSGQEVLHPRSTPEQQQRKQAEEEEEQQQQQQQHTPRKGQQQQQRRTPVKLTPGRQPAAKPGPLRCFPCAVVGRQFQKHEAPCQGGQRLVVEHEPDNPRDAHALLALDAQSRCPLGHLPHVVSRHLAPLLRSQQVVAEAVVTEEPLTDKAPLLVELQIAMQPPAPGGSPRAAGRVAAALGRAEAAAAAQLQQQPQATGERLHSNFLAVLDTVLQHDGHLFAELETGFVAAYKALPLPCQCLFLRLFQRKGPLFSLASLAYREVPDVADAAGKLAEAGLATVVSASSAAGKSADWGQLAGLLTVPDLAAVVAARRIKTGGGGGGSGRGQGGNGLRNREQWLAVLKAHADISPAAAAVLAGWLLDATGTVLQLAAPACEAVSRLQRLFFLNEGHSLSQFLASDLGALQYPRYQVHRSICVFSSRADLLEYEEALVHAAELSDAMEEEDTEAAEATLQHAWKALDAGVHKQERAGVPCFLQRFHSGWVYCVMATAGVSILERQQRYKEAVERLEQLLGGQCCPTRRGDWWVRLTTDLEHLKRPTQALERAEAALADEWLSSGDRLALQRRILRLGKPPRRWKRPHWAEAAQREPSECRIVARPLNNTTGLKSRFYGLDDQQCSVEELALQHYASEEGGGWQGVHSEGGIWATLFGLLLWDVLFMPVPDVFRTPFQTGPLDLDTPSFYTSRKEAVEVCLARVAAGDAPRLLRASWEQHQGALCRGVSWDRHSLEELQLVAECIGGTGLAAVCRLLAQDHAGWSGGMPDLLLWRATSRDAKLAEVKGPRDRLSTSQTAWMNALVGAGLQAEVLKVVEPGQAAGDGNGGKKRRR